MLVAATAVLAAAGCGGKSSETESGYVERITNVELYEVRPVVFEDYLTLPVIVQPYREVNLGLTVGGKVTKLHADKGDRVRKDTTLLETDDVLLRVQLENARSTLDYQKNEFARSEKLFRDGSITEAAYDGAKFQLAQAENVHNMAVKQLEDAVLKAPFDGVVTSRTVEVGDILGPGTPAFRIIDMSRVKVQVGIPEKYVGDFKVGNTVTIRFDAFPGKAFPGKINYVSPEADPSVRTFLAEIDINNGENILKAGIMGNGRILRKTFHDALMIPINAVIETQAGRIIFIAREDGSVEQRSIELGQSGETTVMVLSGLQSGEKVVVKGQHDLIDGEKVNVTGTIAAVTGEESR